MQNEAWKAAVHQGIDQCRFRGDIPVGLRNRLWQRLIALVLLSVTEV